MLGLHYVSHQMAGANHQERVLIMEKLEKVELVREKCNVSYEEAREVLEACGYDVLDAIVMLEQAQQKTEQVPDPIPFFEEAAYELPEGTPAQAGPAGQEAQAKRCATGFVARCKELLNSGMETMFVAERNDEFVFELPVLLVIIGLVLWGASLWLLIVGLFLGFRYRIEGPGRVASRVNDAMGKVADAAESVKKSVA